MSKKNHKKKSNKKTGKEQSGIFVLPEETKRWIAGVLMVLVSTIISLSFFDKAGVAGKTIFKSIFFLIGRTVFIIPLVLSIGGFIFVKSKYKNFFWPAILAILIFILGMSGILEVMAPEGKEGGLLGQLLGWPLVQLFGILVAQIIFFTIFFLSLLIFWQLLKQPRSSKLVPVLPKGAEQKEQPPSLIKQIFAPKFQVKDIEPKIKDYQPPASATPQAVQDLKSKKTPELSQDFQYLLPPLDLLEPERGEPMSGDTRANSAIIKKTLQNFDIPVEMSEVNIGPTVTQYTLKPAEGIKLSKITALSNDLALALASHPIRIEAPIPGRALVGIEVPNKLRCQVRLRNLIENTEFKNPKYGLPLCLGRDVAGRPMYADLSKMPHLLVAGSTGTGKTIFLNSLILSLLYRNSPKILRVILADPKRVEFSAYADLPYLLCPVIYDAQRTVNALQWLIKEMERRFDVLSDEKVRDIGSHNEKAFREKKDPLPYIVLVVDELADLMAAKGREMEAGIVRLAQMARAVGIHLVVATQRPSVEVITGLIKANITSRVTFQVASQVDSRTVLDAAGAEKLLGLGDLLYLSAEATKPRRIQGAFISDKEVKKVVHWIKGKFTEPAVFEENHLAHDLQVSLETQETGDFEVFSGTDDPLYEEAKKVVIEARKASASLLQRRLRLGYARAARLIDVLEQRGVIGPGEGAKPREVYINNETGV